MIGFAAGWGSCKIAEVRVWRQRRTRLSHAAQLRASRVRASRVQGSHLVSQHGLGFRLDVHVAARVGRRIEHLVGQVEGLGDLAVAAGLQTAQLLMSVCHAGLQWGLRSGSGFNKQRLCL